MADDPRPAPNGADAGTLDAENFAELQAAVERLTMAIERLGTPSEAPANEAAPTEAAPRRTEHRPNDAEERRRVLMLLLMRSVSSLHPLSGMTGGD